MILSSSDILRILGADAIIRQEAKLSVVENTPSYGVEDCVYIYIEKYPTVDEFEATWRIWVRDASGMGQYVLGAMSTLLPNFEKKDGYYCTSDFASDRTVVKTEAEKQLEQLAAERQSIKKDFSGLQEGLQARLSTVKDGRNGADGRDGLDGRNGVDGKDGKDGRDGRDIEATETELFDLKDVEQSSVPLKKGQVLTWDGSRWTNLYTRVSSSVGGGGGGGGGTSNVEVLNDLDDVTTDGVQGGQFLQYNSSNGQWEPVSITPGGGIPEAPMDGNFYVRQNATWVNLKDALSQLGVPVDEPIDGGNFTTGFSAATSSTPADGGNFTTGASSAEHGVTLDGGNYTTGQTAADEFSAFGL